MPIAECRLDFKKCRYAEMPENGINAEKRHYGINALPTYDITATAFYFLNLSSDE